MLIPATLLALAGLGPDDPWVFSICILCSWVSFLWICKIHSGPSNQRILVAVAITITLGFVAFRRWPSIWRPTLAVSPHAVYFGSTAMGASINETYAFRMMNKSDEEVYVAEFDFTVNDLSASGQNFVLNIPKDSRKAYAEGGIMAQKFVDTIGFLCKNPERHLLYVVSIQRLAPHESREITIAHIKPTKVALSATTGFFSKEPQPVSPNENEVSTAFRFSTPTDGRGCRPFGFVVDEREHQGMYWFNNKDGKY